LALFTAWMLLTSHTSASAQVPPVPPAFQDLSSSLDTQLANFNAKLGSGNPSAYPTLLTGSLKAADSNLGPTLLSDTNGIELQLNALKAMGAKAILVQVGFPMLYEPFLTLQGQSSSAYVAFYQGLATAIRQAGLKLIVENDTLQGNDVGSGWDVATFYATLNWVQYQEARAQTAAVIAQTMQPDYMVVLEEPDTEAANTSQASVNTASGATSMLSMILASVQQAGVPKLKVGAGVGTWLDGYLSFIQGFVTLPLDFIDMHIYQVNDSFLSNAVQIASTAAAAGKPVSMSECWLSKERDSEVGVISANQVRARNPFSFWAPLDAYFIQTVENLANHTQMLFLDPFNSDMYFANQPYSASTGSLTPAQILTQERSLVFTANQQALYTSAGMSYYDLAVVPADTAPPSGPGGLTGVSGNPATVFLNWNASTDNVGVAGYHVFRNGAFVGTTANTYYQDSVLTESMTYTYWVEAFDLAGNISGLSQSVSVTTADVKPPTALLATPISATKISLTWSAAAGAGLPIQNYRVFRGATSSSLSQVASIAQPAYTDASGSPATRYYYAVQAIDTSANLSAMSATVSSATLALPSAPTGLLATPVSTTKINLIWSAPATQGGMPLASYSIYRGTSPSSLTPLQIVATVPTSFTDTSVTPGYSYYYGIQAKDTAGSVSAMSAVVAVTAPADVVSVAGFGARGDGVHDDAPAVEAAANATPAGGTLFFPLGIYLFNSQTTTSGNHCSVQVQHLGGIHINLNGSTIKAGAALTSGFLFCFNDAGGILPPSIHGGFTYENGVATLHPANTIHRGDTTVTLTTASNAHFFNAGDVVYIQGETTDNNNRGLNIVTIVNKSTGVLTMQNAIGKTYTSSPKIGDVQAYTGFHFSLENGTILPGALEAVGAEQIYDFRISNITLTTNTAARGMEPFQINYLFDVLFDGNTLTSNSGNLIEFAGRGCTDCKAIGNRLTLSLSSTGANPMGDAVDIGEGAERAVVSGNVITSPGVANTNAVDMTASYDSVVSGNTITVGPTRNAGAIATFSGISGAAPYSPSVTNNTILTSADSAIILGAADQAIATGNVMTMLSPAIIGYHVTYGPADITGGSITVSGGSLHEAVLIENAPGTMGTQVRGLTIKGNSDCVYGIYVAGSRSPQNQEPVLVNNQISGCTH